MPVTKLDHHYVFFSSDSVAELPSYVIYYVVLNLFWVVFPLYMTYFWWFTLMKLSFSLMIYLMVATSFPLNSSGKIFKCSSTAAYVSVKMIVHVV